MYKGVTAISDGMVRYLSARDVERAGALDRRRCVAVCEEVFALLRRGDYVMGGDRGHSHGLRLTFPRASSLPRMPLDGPDRRFVAMPAYVGGRFGVCGTKWYGSNQANAAAGLARSNHLLALNDPETGIPIGILSANAISAGRTGAIPVVAAQRLASGASSIAIVGCGAMNRAIMDTFLAMGYEFASVALYDIDTDASNRFSDWLRGARRVAVHISSSATECVERADIVSIAASRARPLRIPESAFAEHATILLTGPLLSDDSLWLNSRIVLDSVPAQEENFRSATQSGRRDQHDEAIGGRLYELIERGEVRPLSESVDLPALLEEPIAGAHRWLGGRTIFISTGMAVFDVALGSDLLETAMLHSIGVDLSF